jgi:shikimate kinase
MNSFIAEERCLLRLSAGAKAAVSTGGNASMSANAMNLFAHASGRLWLDASRQGRTVYDGIRWPMKGPKRQTPEHWRSLAAFSVQGRDTRHRRRLCMRSVTTKCKKRTIYSARRPASWELSA